MFYLVGLTRVIFAVIGLGLVIVYAYRLIMFFVNLVGRILTLRPPFPAEVRQRMYGELVLGLPLVLLGVIYGYPTALEVFM